LFLKIDNFVLWILWVKSMQEAKSCVKSVHAELEGILSAGRRYWGRGPDLHWDWGAALNQFAVIFGKERVPF
jgi:uncharacterized protein (DUF2236 family)